MTLSLSQALKIRFPDIRLNRSMRSLHPFYRDLRESPRFLFAAGVVVSDFEAFPYRTVRAMIEGLEWPSGLVPAREGGFDYPSDRATGWSEELNGVTHDEKNWYIAQKNRLWRFPVGHDLNADVDVDKPPGSVAGLPSVDEQGNSPSQYNHFGDIDLQVETVQGKRVSKLYVPLEAEGTLLRPKVAIYNEILQLLFSATMTAQTAELGASWCAINPLNGLLYSSDFNADRLHVYRADVKSGMGLLLDHLGDFELFDEDGAPLAATRPVYRIQGGCFSARGHLYLSSDHLDYGGILGFDMITGRRVLHTKVDYEPFVAGRMKEELQGITVWPLAPGQSPGVRGQVHLLMIDNGGSGDDDLYFKHFEVEHEGDQAKV